MGDMWQRGREGNEQWERQIQSTLHLSACVGGLDDPPRGAGGSSWEKGHFGCSVAISSLTGMNEKRMIERRVVLTTGQQRALCT